MCHVRKLTAEQTQVLESLSFDQRRDLERMIDAEGMSTTATKRIRDTFERFLKTIQED